VPANAALLRSQEGEAVRVPCEAMMRKKNSSAVHCFAACFAFFKEGTRAFKIFDTAAQP